MNRVCDIVTTAAAAATTATTTTTILYPKLKNLATPLGIILGKSLKKN